MKCFRYLPLVIFLVCLVGMTQAADVWHQVFSRPFDAAAGNNRIFTMAELNGKLFLAAGRAGGTGANVYRLHHAGCALWDNVTPPWGATMPGPIWSSVVFNSHLYVSNENGGVWRYDGTSWADVTGNLPVPTTGTIDVFDMEIFNGQLYVDYGGQIYRTSNSTVVPHVWQLVWNPTFSSPKPERATVESLAVYGSNLYAGVGLDAPYGMQLWRTSNGTSWTMFQDETYWGPFFGIIGHVHAMDPIGNQLVVGEYHGNGLWWTNGLTSSWNYVPNVLTLGAGDTFRFAQRGSTYYAGASNLSSPGTTGTPLLSSSTTGTSWTNVTGAPTVSAASHSITALRSFGGKLYAATAGDTEIAVHELGPAPAPSCDPPIPDIKANNIDDFAFVGASDNLTVTLALTAGTSLLYENADYWVVAVYVDPATGASIPFIPPAGQFPVLDIPAVTWLDVPASSLPHGFYLFMLAVDLNPNGVLDFDSAYVDGVWAIL